MNIKQARGEFISNSILHPPVDYFENNYPNSGQAAKAFLARVDSVLNAKGIEPRDFYDYLKKLMDLSGPSFSFAFFGSSVYGKPFGNPNDIDLIQFMLGTNAVDYAVWDKIPNPGELKFLHIIKKYQDPAIGIDSLKHGVNIFLQSILLYPKRQNGFVKKLMNEMWGDSSGKFFNGGIGDLIALAAFAIVNNGESEYFHQKDAPRILREKIHVPRSTMDGPIHPHEFCHEIRKKISLLPGSDLTKLTYAALRRIRARQDSAEKLAKKFLIKVCK